jgi:hypothetical protein
MTRQRSIKRLVRARMEKTGESYTAARSAMLAAEEPKATQGPALTMSDEAIRRRTGRGWEEWFDLLDEWGAGRAAAQADRSLGLGGARDRRLGGAGGDRDLRACPRPARRRRTRRRLRHQSPRRRWACPSIGCTKHSWTSGETRVIVTFTAKGEAKSAVALQHERLADAKEAERMKVFWRDRVGVLKEVLEDESRRPRRS